MAWMTSIESGLTGGARRATPSGYQGRAGRGRPRSRADQPVRRPAVEDPHVAGDRLAGKARMEPGRVIVPVGPDGRGKTHLSRALSLLAAAMDRLSAGTLAGEGVIPSVLRAGQRGGGQVRMTVGVQVDD